MLFSQEHPPPSKLFSQDKTIIPEKQIKQQLNKLEEKAIALFTNSYSTYLDNAVTDILKKDDPIKAINNYRWGFKNELAKNLWGEWLLGLGKGDQHGSVEALSLSSDVKSFSGTNNVAIFKQPEAEPAIIRNIPAEKAIKERTNQLAADVNNSEWRKIKSALLDAVKPTSPTTPPISRAELLKRINQALGDKKNRFKDRASTIARTELTFAYNAGRLNSYIESGKVSAVKFISILDNRRCPECESRHGLIVPLDDVKGIARIMPPIHPKCRCVISPVLGTEFKTEKQKKQRQLKNRNLITNSAPWLMAGILAAILVGEKAYSRSAAKIAESIKDIAEIGIATSVSQKSKVKSQKGVEEKPITSYPLPITSPNPILLSPKVDLQTATFAQLRSLFTKEQLSDKNIYAILDYRDKNGLTSIDDLRKVLGIGQVKLQNLHGLAEKNQLLSFLDPRPNSTALTLWVEAGGVLDKAQARTIHKIVKAKQFKSIEELEIALKNNGIEEKIIADLKQKAADEQQKTATRLKELQKIGQAETDVIRAPAGKGGAIVPVRRIQPTPAQQAARISRGARLSAIDNSLADVEGQISLLRSRVELDIKSQQQRLGLQEVIDDSTQSVTTVKQVSTDLISDLNPLSNQVTALNTRIQDLEAKLAGLLNPNIEDYFAVRPTAIKSIQTEIQAIRGQLNQINRFTNAQKRAASDRAKQLTAGQKRLKGQLPSYREPISTIESQLDRIASQLDTESLTGKSKVAISGLRAKYRDLTSQLQSLEVLQNKPFQQYSGDKKAISGYLGEVKNKSRNLSNRLGNLETRINALPKRVTQLAPSVRRAYRKMPTALTRLADYEPPVRIAPGVQGQQARLVKASRAQRQATIDNEFNSINAIASELTTVADDEFLSTKNWKRKPIKKQIESSITQYEKQLENSNKLKQDLAIASKQASTQVIVIETSIDDLARLVQADIYDPLGDNWFDSKGNISKKVRSQNRDVRKGLDRAISDIDNQLSKLKSAKNKATSLKKQLQSIRGFADGITINPASKTNLDRQIESMLAELEGLTKFEVAAAYYNSQIKQYREELTSLLQGESPLLNSQIKTNLDRLLTQVEQLETSLTTSYNAGTVTTLTQAKQRLISQRDRLKAFPRRVKDLPESARIEWEETRGVRDVTKKANRKLDNEIASYREEATKQITKTQEISKAIDEAVADVLDSDVYRKNLDDAIKQQQDTIKVAIADLDDNLKLLKLATNTEQGLQLVYADLKKIYDANIPGLALLTEGTFPVGLDEAMEVKRKIIDFLKDRGEQLQKKITLTLNSDKARLTTRYKLSVVENQILELEKLQNQIVTSQKTRATQIEKSLSELFQADPVFYKDLNPTSILGEIQENTITQANIIK